jgi:hypothetical protein
MELTGTIKLVKDIQTFDSGFQKREFVLTTTGEYPQDIKFELLKDNVDKLNKSHENLPFEVHFDIRGREYNGNYYNNLVCWKVKALYENNADGSHTPHGKVNDAFDGTGDEDPPF